MDSVAVVTGGGRGLGAAIAHQLHDRGYRVAVADIDSGAAKETAAELDPDGDTAIGVELDVRKRKSFEAVRDRVIQEWGGIDVLVNNAGRSQTGSLMDITPEEFSDIVEINLNGAFLGCQVFGSYFAGKRYGRIVNIASLAGQNGGTATGAHYAAAKGGVGTLTKVFARELAPAGVTVNAVSPGRWIYRWCVRRCPRTSWPPSSPRFRWAPWARPTSLPRPLLCSRRRRPRR